MNDSQKEIAVIACTYKGDSSVYLDRMLSSVFSANLPIGYKLNFYLHIDGDISSEHKKIISKFPLYRIIESDSPQGLAKGLNKLILALGNEEYIFRMDADDICLPFRFVRQIEYMNENPAIEISGGGISEFIGCENSVVSTRTYPKNDLISYLEKASPFAHVTIVFRKGFFDKYGLYPTQYPLNEDIAYWLQVLKLGALGGNIDDVIVLVRMDGAYTRRSLVKARTEFLVYRKVAKYRRHLPIYATIRFLFRLLPPRLVKIVYNSSFRTSFLNLFKRN